MTDVGVTADARQRFVGIDSMSGNFPNIVFVAIKAVRVENCATFRLNLNRFVEILKGKPLGMVVTVASFGEPFSQKIVRNMTIIASRIAVMARLLPTVILIAHNMAVDASFWVAGEIR